MKEKYELYKERLEQALALAQPADGSVVEQKPPVLEEKPSEDGPAVEQKTPQAQEEPVAEQETCGDESVC